jgi:3-hydroxyisobutyrate dehydrogenase-like beta-hydroxyacid dehydrogenase
MTITVLGLGPMGQALARALLDTGHRVTVWNRTEARADALADRTVVGLSSDTPDRARRTAALVHTHGGRYLDGAIMTPTDTIGTPGAAILLAGPKQLADAHRTALESLGRITWVGDEHGRAAAFDMALLDLFWTSVAGFEHALMVARANGITPAELLPHARGIVDILAPVFTEIAARIGEDRHHDDVTASVRHLIAASREAGVDPAMLEVFGGHVDAAVAAGHGAEEISRIAAHMVVAEVAAE